MCRQTSVLVFIYHVGFVLTATINDTETLQANLFQNYNRNVRPIYDQSSAINVNVTLYMKSIQEFDEVNEKFAFTSALLVVWYDYRMQWITNQYGQLDQITVSYEDVWVPELTLSSPSDKAVTLGKASDRIRIYSNGLSEWFAANLIESTCSVSVRNYPFDKQSCTTSFTSLGYKNYEVTLGAPQKTIDFSVYSENALWAVEGSETGTIVIGSGGESEILFTVKLKRKPSFVVLNVLMPILVLSLLNVFVFVLVPESGERIGYCITTLLAIAVYMTIVSDMLPRTSEPVPLISYKLMFDLIISSLIVIVTIVNLRYQNTDDDVPVPNWLEGLYRRLCCRRSVTSKIGPEQKGRPSLNPDTTSVKNIETDIPVKNRLEDISSVENVTWKKISIMIDWIALFGFLTLSLLSFVVFISVTKAAST